MASRITVLTLDDAMGVPIGNEPVYCNGEIIGKTTSAAFGYRIGRPVALAYLGGDRISTLEGARVEINIAERFAANVSLKAAFDAKAARLRPARAAGQA